MHEPKHQEGQNGDITETASNLDILSKLLSRLFLDFCLLLLFLLVFFVLLFHLVLDLLLLGKSLHHHLLLLLVTENVLQCRHVLLKGHLDARI